MGFGGRVGTLAGRLGSKFAPLRARGAVGIIAVHEDFPASYPWSQVANGDAVPRYALETGSPPPARAEAQLSMRRDVAVALLARAGLDYAALKSQSQSRAFRAIPISGATLSVDTSAIADRVVSRNVVGLLPGTDRAAETVLYGAHWDAYGRNAFDPPSDPIRNGAVDNATGTATMLEIARAFAAGPRPRRSILFAAWTAEEKGCWARPGMRGTPSGRSKPRRWRSISIRMSRWDGRATSSSSARDARPWRPTFAAWRARMACGWTMR